MSSIYAQETEEKMFCGNGICEQDLGENKTLCPNFCHNNTANPSIGL